MGIKLQIQKNKSIVIILVSLRISKILLSEVNPYLEADQS